MSALLLKSGPDQRPHQCPISARSRHTRPRLSRHRLSQTSNGHALAVGKKLAAIRSAVSSGHANLSKEMEAER